MYAKQRDKLRANLSPQTVRWNIGVDCFTMPLPRIPRNIEQKNSSPLKIKRVKFVKILSSNSPSFFSARQIHARFFPLPYKSSTYTHTHTHARTFFPVQRFLGREEKGEGYRKIRDSRKNLDERGENMGHCSRTGFRSFRKRGSREKGAQPFICLGEACRVRAPRHTLTVSTNFTPNFQLARTPPDLHNILEIFYKISPPSPPSSLPPLLA